MHPDHAPRQQPTKRAVPPRRELIALAVLMVIWLGIAAALTGLRTSGGLVENVGMYVDAGTFALLAVLMVAFGAPGRRWIAVLPAVLVPVQAAQAAVSNDTGEDLLFGWLMPTSLTSTADLLPYIAGTALFMVITMMAWAFAFGRKAGGVVVAGVLGMLFLVLRGWYMVENVFTVMDSGVQEFLLVHAAAPLVFLVAILASLAAGNGALATPRGRPVPAFPPAPASHPAPALPPMPAARPVPTPSPVAQPPWPEPTVRAPWSPR